jgi:hypothetical protein
MVVNMNNPPAFPSGNEVTLGNWKSHGHSGMTLRDYFAARGIETLMKSVTSELESKHYSIDKAQKIQDVYASMCYAMADAMMRAREK